MPESRGIDLTYLGLGSNVGPREATILEAASSIRRLSVDGYIRVSSLYESTPVDCGPMRDFINAVVELMPLHPPCDLLNRLQAMERAAGRESGHNKPRELDIDIISMGERVLRTQGLTIPHPAFATRAFVLVPLRELAPGFRCPVTGRNIDDMVADLDPRDWVRQISSRSILSRANT